MLDVTFSPDGETLATSSIDETARLWSPETGLPIEGAEAMFHKDDVVDVDFDFSSGRDRMLTASLDGTVVVWESGEEGKSLPGLWGAPVHSASFSDDGNWIIAGTGGDDNKARVWNAATLELQGPPLQHRSPVTFVALTASDGDAGLPIAWTGTSRRDSSRRQGEAEAAMLRLDSNEPIDLAGGREQLDLVSISPDSGRFAMVFDNHKPECQLVIQQISDGKITTVYEETIADANVTDMKLNSDGKLLAIGFGDGRLRLWNLESPGQVKIDAKFNSRFHEGSIVTLAFSRDGSKLLSGSQDNSARLWFYSDIEKTLEPVGEPIWHEATVISAAFSPDGSLVATGSHDGTARVGPADNGVGEERNFEHDTEIENTFISPQASHAVILDHSGAAEILPLPALDRSIALGGAVDVSFSKNGRKLLLVTGDSEPTRVIDFPEGTTEQTLPDANIAVLSDDGAWALTAKGANAILSDAKTGKQLVSPLSHREGEVISACAISPDHRKLLTGTEKGTIRVWDATSGVMLEVLDGHEEKVTAAAFSAGGKWILTASNDGTALILDSGQILKSFERNDPIEHEEDIFDAMFSPDGSKVLTASKDNTAALWHSETAEQIGESMRHENPVHAIAFSPDGRFVMSASEDGTARLWDAMMGEPITEVLHHEGAIHSIGISPDGRFAFTGGANPTVRIWKIPPPATGNPAWLRRSVEARTGYFLNKNGSRAWLGKNEWLRRMRSLEREAPLGSGDLRNWRDVSPDEMEQWRGLTRQHE